LVNYYLLGITVPVQLTINLIILSKMTDLLMLLLKLPILGVL